MSTEAAKLRLPAASAVRHARGRPWAWAAGAALFAVGAAAAGLVIGPVDVGFGTVVRVLSSHVLGTHTDASASQQAIVWELRAPRVVLGLLVGALLSAAGATYQGAFRNPLADPYLLGVAAGAGLGATFAIAYARGATLDGDLLPLAAFAGGIASVSLTYVIGRAAGRSAGPAAFVLAGVTVASFLTAIQTFVQQRHADTLQAVYSWILGQLDTAGWHDVLLLLPYAAVSGATLLLYRRSLDVLTLGDEEAASLGVNVARLRLVLVTAATLGTAAAVAVSGLIGFLGVIVPHTVRLLAGGSYRLVLPLSILVGGGFLVFCDVLARTLMAPGELPIGVVTAFFGAPFFAVVLRTSRRT